MHVVIYRRLEYKWDCLRAHTIVRCSAFLVVHCALCVQCCLAPTGQDIHALYVLCGTFLSSCVHISALTLGSSICQALLDLSCLWLVWVCWWFASLECGWFWIYMWQATSSVLVWEHVYTWTFTISPWHIDAAQNGCSYQNMKHAKCT